MRKFLSFLLFLILYVLVGGIFLFYLDLANGPLWFNILSMAVIVIFGIVSIIMLNRRRMARFIKWMALLTYIVISILIARPSESYNKATDLVNKTEELTLNNGKIVGTLNRDEDVRIYAGIPYAKAPLGELRWKEPQDVENWQGTLDCTSFKAKSMQKQSNPIVDTLIQIYAERSWHPDYQMYPTEICSEDSLYINVWRPNNNETNLPVLVYIHGGSLMTGSGSFSDYNGEELAKKNVIMVTIQYRLGIFGYLALDELANESVNHTTGNYGLLDQIKALKFINDNIHYFGGDKNNITIAGESAGSSSVSAICASPLAKNLFKKAVGESSSVVLKTPPHTFRTMEKAREMGNNILNEFKVSSVNDLRKIDAKLLVNSKYENNSMTVDGYALPKTPYEIYQDGNNNEEALFNGYNVKEADAFIIPRYLLPPSFTNRSNIKERLEEVFKDKASDILALYDLKTDGEAFEAFNEIFSAYWFMYPHYVWSEMASNNGVNVYRYQFTKTNGYYSTYHSGEMIYLYGNVKNAKKKYRYNESDIELSNTMNSYLVNFVKTGNPNGNNLVNWEKWDKTNNKLIEFGDKVAMFEEKYLRLFEIFGTLQ